jgi:hypothetical protein
LSYSPQTIIGYLFTERQIEFGEGRDFSAKRVSEGDVGNVVTSAEIQRLEVGYTVYDVS